MGIPQERTFDIIQFKQDKVVYDYWFSRQFGGESDDCDLLEKISAMLYAAIQLELSEKQRIYFTEYYLEGLTVCEIGDEHGVNVSSVSRTIGRARGRLERVLKYVDPKLMRLFERKDPPGQKRNNLSGHQRFKVLQGGGFDDRL